jgi:hypothetical protein
MNKSPLWIIMLAVLSCGVVSIAGAIALAVCG